MALHPRLFLLLLSSALVAKSFSFDDATFNTNAHFKECNSDIRDCINDDEEAMMESEVFDMVFSSRFCC
ncbi:hypothetical protein ACSBR1_016039 [Camellia fascicularis]